MLFDQVPNNEGWEGGGREREEKRVEGGKGGWVRKVLREGGKERVRGERETDRQRG